MAISEPRDGSLPPLEGGSNAAYVSYVPHDLKYSAEFEDCLMSAVLNPSNNQQGIRIIPEDSDEQPIDGDSVRASDIDVNSLPTITEEELPLPLSDPRRIFASAVPGVKLTHPGGYLEGGPGLDPEMDTFPDDFLSNNTHVGSAEELRGAIQKEIDENVILLKERLRARQKAKEANEGIEKELKALMDQHSMELKIHDRMAEETQQKKEARERKKREREGG